MKAFEKIHRSKKVAALTKSGRFEAWCKEAFEKMDLDKSGKIEAGELFAAVLLLYNQVNSKLPARKEYVLSRTHHTPRFASSDSSDSPMLSVRDVWINLAFFYRL